MAAGIAHELKNPLVSIGGFARRLGKKLPSGSAEWEYAETIVREVKRLEKLLTEILAFSKKSTISYDHCDIKDIIEDALTIVAPTLKDSRIKVIKHYPRDKVTFPGDSERLKQYFSTCF